MWWPIVVVPTIVPAGVAAVFSRRAAKTVLPLASAAGGRQRRCRARSCICGASLQKPGGLANLRYNIEMGPPAFAPCWPSMVGGMGLLASLLRREGD